jgi:hypothetical protein
MGGELMRGSVFAVILLLTPPVHAEGRLDVDALMNC